MGIKLKGEWCVRLYGAPDELKEERRGTNIITNAGKSFVAAFLDSAATAAATFTMRFCAIGSGGTAEAASNTALGTELARTTGVVTSAANAIYRVEATFTSGIGTGAVVEYGLFSSSTGGTLFNRDVESVINKGANDTLVVSTDITVG